MTNTGPVLRDLLGVDKTVDVKTNQYRAGEVFGIVFRYLLLHTTPGPLPYGSPINVGALQFRGWDMAQPGALPYTVYETSKYFHLGFELRDWSAALWQKFMAPRPNQFGPSDPYYRYRGEAYPGIE